MSQISVVISPSPLLSLSPLQVEHLAYMSLLFGSGFPLLPPHLHPTMLRILLVKYTHPDVPDNTIHTMLVRPHVDFPGHTGQYSYSRQSPTPQVFQRLLSGLGENYRSQINLSSNPKNLPPEY